MVSECFSLTFTNIPSPDKGPFLIEKMKCKKTFDPEQSGGGILKSGSTKK